MTSLTNDNVNLEQGVALELEQSQAPAPDEKTFWHKMKTSAKRAGEELAVMGIKSWLAVADSNTSVRHKAVLGGALAYFVLPTDMVPDVMAGVGFTDDMAALTLAANSVGNAITDEHEQQARDKWHSMTKS
ncbi:YkvA family protein [Vibrio taketomensis]|uniref:YkvA family protein n=1 Tax=Vibrio taketomensis TaxID=2572923 RepID=UPI00138988CA|nr:YkvA family protein [Vibrio taketomensis]